MPFHVLATPAQLQQPVTVAALVQQLPLNAPGAKALHLRAEGLCLERNATPAGDRKAQTHEREGAGRVVAQALVHSLVAMEAERKSSPVPHLRDRGARLMNTARGYVRAWEDPDTQESVVTVRSLRQLHLELDDARAARRLGLSHDRAIALARHLRRCVTGLRSPPQLLEAAAQFMCAHHNITAPAALAAVIRITRHAAAAKDRKHGPPVTRAPLTARDFATAGALQTTEPALDPEPHQVRIHQRTVAAPRCVTTQSRSN